MKKNVCKSKLWNKTLKFELNLNLNHGSTKVLAGETLRLILIISEFEHVKRWTQERMTLQLQAPGSTVHELWL